MTAPSLRRLRTVVAVALLLPALAPARAAAQETTRLDDVSPSGSVNGPTPSAPVTRVQVLRVAGSEQLFARVVAELRAQGFDVASDVGALSGNDVDGVTREARSWLNASSTTEAALALESTPATVRIWVINANTSKQLFREAQREPNTELDNAIVALWAVELLRATGLSAASERPASRALPKPLARPARPASPALPPPRPTPALWSLHLGPALEASPGGASAALALSVGARIQPLAHFGGELGAFLPLTPARTARGQNQAQLAVALAHAGAFVAINPAAARWRAEVGLGAALALVNATGESSQAAYATTNDRVFAGGPYGRVGAGGLLVGRLGLHGDVFAGALFPRPVVLFDEEPVARWGRPWLAARLALEVAF